MPVGMESEEKPAVGEIGIGATSIDRRWAKTVVPERTAKVQAVMLARILTEADI